MKKALLISLVLSASVWAADTASINRLPYSLECQEAHLNGHGVMSLSNMSLYRQDGQLYLNATLSTSSQDQIVSSYLEHILPKSIVLSGQEGKKIRYELDSINPKDSRLQAGQSYQIKLSIKGTKDDPVDIHCTKPA